ncbi:MAG TPA: hypothetical protein VIC05_12690 [Solirubrobacteraceae bacterium]
MITTHNPHRRLAAACAATLSWLGLAAVATGAVTSAYGAGSGPVARSAARTLKATDTAHLHYIHTSGSMLYETGSASGTLPGRMRADVNVGATISGTFTIYIRGGTIRGHGSATPHGSGVYESFAGSLVATGGTGRYRHAHGRAQLYGTFNRNNYSLVIQTAGTLLY